MRGDAILAMYRANGTASTAHRTVTTSATPTVRSVTVRNTSSVNTLVMLSPVKVCTTAPVNELVVQNAETSSTTSEPRYATASQVSGGTSRNARPHRLRGGAAGGSVV